jgi:hypothetical protein
MSPSWYSYHTSGLYHLRNNGCMGFDGVGVTSSKSNRCW